MYQFLFWFWSAVFFLLAFDFVLSFEINTADRMQDDGDDYLVGLHDISHRYALLRHLLEKNTYTFRDGEWVLED